MKKVLFIFALLLAPCAHAQLWSGILSACPSTYATSGCGNPYWQNVGIPGGPPSGSWTQYGTTITSTGSDQTSAIQAAINAASAAGNEYVLLAPGTFQIAGTVTIKSASMLRGAGANQTILNCTSTTANCIVIGTPTWPTVTGGTIITSGNTAGSSSITVTSASGFATGKLLVIDQTNDGTTVNSNGSEGQCTWCDGGQSSNGNYAQGQISQITSVAGTTIGIWPPLLVAYTRTPTAIPFAAACTLCGVENLTVYANNTHTGSPSANGSNIIMGNALYPWVSGVATNYTDGDHIDVQWSLGWEILNHYASNTYMTGAGSVDHGITIWEKSSFGLMQNSVMDRTGVLELSRGAAGNVIGYNYLNGFYSCSPVSGSCTASPNFFVGGIETHGADVQFNLLEGNVTPSIRFENIWGSNHNNTRFRNWITGANIACNPLLGTRSTVSCTPMGVQGNAGINGWWEIQDVDAMDVNFQSTYENFVGDVIGSAAMTALLPYNTGSTPMPTYGTVNAPAAKSYDAKTYGIAFGYGEANDYGGVTIANGVGCDGAFSYPCESTAPASTAFFYNDFNNQSGTTVCTGTCTMAMPPSFYLGSIPPWWPQSIPFPAIGSDVSGGTGPGGHASLTASNLAQQTYLGRMNGSLGGAGSPLTFNALTYFGMNSPTPPLTYVDHNEHLCMLTGSLPYYGCRYSDGHGGYLCSPSIYGTPGCPAGTPHTPPSYEFTLGSSSSLSGSLPSYCTTGSPPIFGSLSSYGANAAGLDAFIVAMEGCRTASLLHSACVSGILDIPPGSYPNSIAPGNLIPQTSATLSTCPNIVRSSAHATLDGMPKPVGGGGIQDNVNAPTVTNIGLHNADGTGTNMYDVEGAQNPCTIASGSSPCPGTITGITTISVNTTALESLTAGPLQHIDLTDGYVSPTLAPGSGCLTIDAGGAHPECLAPQVGVDQTGMWVTPNFAHTAPFTVTYVPNNGAGSGSFTLNTYPSGTTTNISAYNYLQYEPQLIGSYVAHQAIFPIVLCNQVSISGVINCGGTITFGPDNWQFQYLATTLAPGNTNTGQVLIETGANAAVNATSSCTTPPFAESCYTNYAHHIDFNGMLVYGDWRSLMVGSTSIVNAVEFNGCYYCSFTDSQITQVVDPGSESHGIYLGGNLLKITNNRIECCSIRIFSGGLDQPRRWYQNQPNTDVQIGRNYVGQVYSWLGMMKVPAANPNFSGTPSVVWKNCMEFKVGQRVEVYGNIFDGSDSSGGQSGVCIAVTPNASGMPNYLSADMGFDYNIVRNYDNGGAAADIRGPTSDGGSTFQIARFRNSHDLFYAVGKNNPGAAAGNSWGSRVDGGQQSCHAIVSETSGVATAQCFDSIDQKEPFYAVFSASGGSVVYIPTNNTFAQNVQFCGGPTGEYLFVQGFTTAGNNSGVGTGGSPPAGFLCTSSTGTVLGTAGSMVGGCPTGSPAACEILTDTNAPFTSAAAMVGAEIQVTQCGNAAGTTTLETSIASWTDASHVRLANACNATASSVTGITETISTLTLANSNAGAAPEADDNTAQTNSYAYPILSNTPASYNAVGNELTLDMLPGNPAFVSGCTNVPGFNMPINSSFHNVATGIGPLIITGNGPWGGLYQSWPGYTGSTATVPAATGNGTWASSVAMVTYLWTGYDGQSDLTGNCILSNGQGGPSNVTWNHLGFIGPTVQESIYPIRTYANGGPTLMLNHANINSYFISQPLATEPNWNGGWDNGSADTTGLGGSEGLATERFDYDANTLSTWAIFPGRTASDYIEFPNNPNFPEGGPGWIGGTCSGTITLLNGKTPDGCSPVNMYFPTTSCGMGFTGTGAWAYGCSTNAVPFTVSDYHQFEIQPGSTYSATGGTNPSPDGSGDWGPNIPLIDWYQTHSYPGAFPDSLTGSTPSAAPLGLVPQVFTKNNPPWRDSLGGNSQ